MKRCVQYPAFPKAYCLVELLLVLFLIAACVTGGVVVARAGLAGQEARGSAQSLQAAAAWAQLGVLWHGGETDVQYAHDHLVLDHDIGSCGGDLGASAPGSPIWTNIARWRTDDGVEVKFGGRLASPDSGGSLYLVGVGGSYRVTIRPESGLTTRAWTDQ